MRIAIPDFVSSTSIPLILAKDLRFFDDEGQDVDIVTIRTGYVEALRDGAVDFSAGTAHHPLTVFPDWRGVKLVGDSIARHALDARNESGSRKAR